MRNFIARLRAKFKRQKPTTLTSLGYPHKPLKKHPEYIEAFLYMGNGLYVRNTKTQKYHFHTITSSMADILGGVVRGEGVTIMDDLPKRSGMKKVELR